MAISVAEFLARPGYVRVEKLDTVNVTFGVGFLAATPRPHWLVSAPVVPDLPSSIRYGHGETVEAALADWESGQ